MNKYLLSKHNYTIAKFSMASWDGIVPPPHTPLQHVNKRGKEGTITAARIVVAVGKASLNSVLSLCVVLPVCLSVSCSCQSVML